MECKKRNIILADCNPHEIMTFKKGLENVIGIDFLIKSNISNVDHGSKWRNLKRYWKYFIFSFNIFLHRNEYDKIVGWQQFYVNILAFYCHLFGVKKTFKLISCNFTYKRKSGFIGIVYQKFMKYAICNEYIDYIHISSHGYASRCITELGIPSEKIIVTPFGIPDDWKKWKSTTPPEKNYILSIGRSNRDFKFLINAWKSPLTKDYLLVIISDTFISPIALPQNVRVYNNIVGDDSNNWIAHCELLVIPIDDGNIASGDTVLLKGMAFGKSVIVTKPSTLTEMYVNNGIDAFAVEKDNERFAELVKTLMTKREIRIHIGKKARQSYLEKFSRIAMGMKIGEGIK